MTTHIPVTKKDSTDLTTIVNLLKNNIKQNGEKVNELKTTLQTLITFTLHNQIENSMDKFNMQNQEQNKQILNKIKELSEQEKQLSDSLKSNK